MASAENVKAAVKEFKSRLRALYGSRLKRIILYGSWARGEATPESDIDLLVVLAGQVAPGQEIDRMIEAITDINLKYNILLAIYPISEENYTAGRSPLLLNVHREGKPA